jgi:hypothetical protein
VAFEQATGRSLVDAERSFHAELTSWTRRLPLLTSPFVLWMIVTLLALFAIYVRCRRSAERRRKWAEEDARDVGWQAEETLADETNANRSTFHCRCFAVKNEALSGRRSLHCSARVGGARTNPPAGSL